MLSISTASAGPPELSLAQAERKVTQLGADLASGLRVRSAIDDPSGYAIAARIDATVASTDAGSLNVESADDAVTIASGALQTVVEIVRRIRNLAVSANTDLLSPTERKSVQAEIDALRAEIDTISARTQYNGVALFSQAAPPTPALVQCSTVLGTQIGATAKVDFVLGRTPQPGNVLVVAVAYGHGIGGGLPPPTIAPPPGWTLVTSQNSGNDNGLSIYTHTVVPGDGVASTFTFTPTDYESGCIIELSGADPKAPVAASAINTVNPPGTVTTPTLKATLPNELPLAFHEVNGPSSTPNSNPTRGWSEIGTVIGQWHPFEAQIGTITTATGQSEQDAFTWAPGNGGPGESAIVLVKPARTTPQLLRIQSGAQEGSVSTISLVAVDSYSLGLDGLDVTQVASSISTANNVSTVLGGAVLAEQAVDEALTYLTFAAAQLGAQTVGLDTRKANNDLFSVNSAASSSQIRDLDVAQATAAYTKERVLEQFSTALLAQSNVNRQAVLALFQGSAAVPGFGATS